jgi:hypothetical protein
MQKKLTITDDERVYAGLVRPDFIGKDLEAAYCRRFAGGGK